MALKILPRVLLGRVVVVAHLGAWVLPILSGPLANWLAANH